MPHDVMTITRFQIFARSRAIRLGDAILFTYITLSFSGCSDSSQPPAKVTSGKVVIKGSNTLGEELVPRLIAEYKKDHPGVSFELESKGTATGFSALLAGQCDVAA